MTNPQIVDDSVTATLVTPEDRLSTLPKHFPYCFTRFENTVYMITEKICGNYNGGFWEFYELSNGGFYMAPDMTEPCSISIPFGNSFEGSMSAQALGITVCLYVYCFLAEDEELMADHYAQLHEFAMSHAEGGVIWQATD